MKAFIFAFILIISIPASLFSEDITWVEVPLEEVNTKLLSRRGLALLKDEDFKWDHAHTDHFVIHFERKQFAQKVARMAEFFYTFISTDLQTAKDRVSDPSHIFIFRKAKRWELFLEKYNIQTEWAISLVAGYTMYLQQAGSLNSSGQILGHEMTHMIVNRFYNRRLPIWLSEGTAEWYGTFGYDAYRGTRKNKKHAFGVLKKMYPLSVLLGAEDYPEDRRAVSSFYQTSKYLVGFLQLKFPEEKFDPFLNDIMRGTPSSEALKKHYEIESLEEFAKEFRRFSR